MNMNTLPAELYTVKQIRELEQLAVTKYNIPEKSMMERAGHAAFEALLDLDASLESIAVICGTGNNGGDGYVLARLAKQHDYDVKVYYAGELEKLTPIAKDAYQACLEANVPIQAFTPESVLEVDVIVDAILGLGLRGQVHGCALAAIQAINASPSQVLSIDVPSGLDADTGNVLGEAVVASMTITFIGNKRGLMTGEARDYCGTIVCDPIDLPVELLEQVDLAAYRIILNDVQDLFELRPLCAHKGLFGHVLVIGGDYGMPGAARMAAEAAVRSGAGLVTVATRPEHVCAIVSGRPELMCYGVTRTEQLAPLLERANVIVVGPGLSESRWSQDLFHTAVESTVATVVDAGALTLLANEPLQCDDWIVTPHPGEAARLLNCTPMDIQADRYNSAIELQKMVGGVCVLKGAGTIVQIEDELPEVCDIAHPAMASAGMGDILSGIIAGLVAQEFSLGDAACAGVCLHANAAKNASGEHERGVLALDLFGELRNLINPSTTPVSSDLAEMFNDMLANEEFEENA